MGLFSICQLRCFASHLCYFWWGFLFSLHVRFFLFRFLLSLRRFVHFDILLHLMFYLMDICINFVILQIKTQSISSLRWVHIMAWNARRLLSNITRRCWFLLQRISQIMNEHVFPLNIQSLHGKYILDLPYLLILFQYLIVFEYLVCIPNDLVALMWCKR